MIGKRRYGRPGSTDVGLMIFVNLLLSSAVLLLVFLLFGVGVAIGQLPLAPDQSARTIAWMLYGFTLPGAAIGYALLWFWLIVTGRTPKGLNWGAAVLHGAAIGLFCLPIGSLCTGILLGDPMLAVLLALVSLVMVPSIAVSMVFFGLVMGAINGAMAQAWIEKHRPKSDS